MQTLLVASRPCPRHGCTLQALWLAPEQPRMSWATRRRRARTSRASWRTGCRRNGQDGLPLPTRPDSVKKIVTHVFPSLTSDVVHMEALYETVSQKVAETLAGAKAKAKTGARSADDLAPAIASLIDIALAPNDRFESSKTSSTPAEADSAILKVKERYVGIRGSSS